MNQLSLFIIYIALGIILSIIFDIFKSYRNVLSNSKKSTIVLDLLFSLICGFILIYTTYKINYGEVRIYLLLGIIIGIIIYYITISKSILNIFTGFFSFIKKIKEIFKKIVIKCNFFIKKMYKNKGF